jgi:hypothetical protein
MKLCSQCEFIYEDDQERCDMDGAELVYEPTLEHVFPKSALAAKAPAERPVPTRLIIPLSGLPQPEAARARPKVFATGKRFTLQIAAVVILAVGAFAAFYAVPRLFENENQTSTSTFATQNPKRETAQLSGVVPAASGISDKPEARNAQLDNSVPSDQLETRNSKLETTPAAAKLKTPNSIPETEIPALPGLKPLPRLKPLPTLKPIPRLAEQSRPGSVNRRAVVVNTKGNATPKKESRFGSFLKKTGRILTKPFKS